MLLIGVTIGRCGWRRLVVGRVSVGSIGCGSSCMRRCLNTRGIHEAQDGRLFILRRAHGACEPRVWRERSSRLNARQLRFSSHSGDAGRPAAAPRSCASTHCLCTSQGVVLTAQSEVVWRMGRLFDCAYNCRKYPQCSQISLRGSLVKRRTALGLIGGGVIGMSTPISANSKVNRVMQNARPKAICER